MRLAVVLLALALGGCTDDDHLPPGPGGAGGGGGGGGVTPDAGEVPDDEVAITGTACLVLDLRFPGACPGLGLGQFTIGEWPDGPFTEVPASGDFTFTVDRALETVIGTQGDQTEPVLVPVPIDTDGASDVLVPAIDSGYWTDLLTVLGVTLPDGTGAIVLYLIEDGAPAIGAQVLAPDGTAFAPFYDAGGPFEWTQAGLSGIDGVALIIGSPVLGPQTTVTVLSADLDQVVVDLPIADGQITTASVVIP